MGDLRGFADCGMYISYVDRLLEWERSLLIDINAVSSLVICHLLSASLRVVKSKWSQLYRLC